MARTKKPVDPARAAFRAAHAKWGELESKAVLHDVRICFAIAYFDNEALAVEAGKASAAVNTYNGGYYHGMKCGRDPGHDYTDANGRKLFAVTN